MAELTGDFYIAIKLSAYGTWKIEIVFSLNLGCVCDI